LRRRSRPGHRLWTQIVREGIRVTDPHESRKRAGRAQGVSQREREPASCAAAREPGPAAPPRSSRRNG
jgi:hypothetical protein